MSQGKARTHHCLSESEMLETFQAVGGYANGQNDTFADFLLKLELSEEANRKDKKRILPFIKCLYSISLLQLINSWQWFLTSEHLRGFSAAAAQRHQNGYYALFFAMASFLSLNVKGTLTIGVSVSNGEVSKIRRSVWLDLESAELCIADIRSKGGEHQSVADWYYQTFRNYDNRSRYCNIEAFANDPKYHAETRNWFTYSLSTISEDLYESPTIDLLSNDNLLELWDGQTEAIEIYPETVYTLEHLKLVTDIHSKLFQLDQSGSMVTNAQEILVRCFLDHCKINRRMEFIEVPFKAIIESLGRRKRR